MRQFPCLLLVIVGVLLRDGVEANPARLCPEGFYYAGDDTPGIPVSMRSSWTEEVSKSPDYSCYKWMVGRGFNDALGTCRSMHSQASIVAFEDITEAGRFFQLLFSEADAKKDEEGVSPQNLTVLTSALFFEDVQKWIWLGSDYRKIPVTYAVIRDNSSQQCLAVDGHRSTETTSFAWKAVECNSEKIMFGCEVRARTVTYVTWFYTNWVTVFLIFLIIILMITLCISAITHTTSTKQAKQYRAGQEQQMAIRTASEVVEPPTYSEVTGGEETPATGKMDKYVGKGKELLGKIYLYKP